MTPTLLKIQGAGMPPMLLEECTQTLETIALGGLHRTVNGELIYTGVVGLIKYQSVCTGIGKSMPGFEGLKRGDVVTVECIQRLWQEVTTPEVTLSRPAVENTVLVMDHQRQAVAFTQVSPTEVKLEPQPEPLYLSYCPVLTMRVIEMKFNMTEWDDKMGWKISLEEV